MSPSADTVARVIRVVAATQHIPESEVGADSTFEQLKIDSLDGINILFALENEFSVDIPDDAAREIRGIKDAAVGIDKLLNGRARGA